VSPSGRAAPRTRHRDWPVCAVGRLSGVCGPRGAAAGCVRCRG
jgi:hypothetical protein